MILQVVVPFCASSTLPVNRSSPSASSKASWASLKKLLRLFGGFLASSSTVILRFFVSISSVVLGYVFDASRFHIFNALYVCLCVRLVGCIESVKIDIWIAADLSLNQITEARLPR